MDKKSYVELLGDRNFTQGFYVSTNKWTVDGVLQAPYLPPSRATYANLYDPEVYRAPVWRIGQWQSMYNLLDSRVVVEEGVNTLASVGQAYKLAKDAAGNSTFTMEINGSVEFPEARPDSWPHVCIETDMHEYPALSELERLVLDMDFKIDGEKKAVPPEMRHIPAEDACLLSVTFILQNRTATKPGFGEDMIWFQCDLWDYRWTVWAGGGIHIDGDKPDASAKPIYTVPTTELMGEPYRVIKEGAKQIGEQSRLHVDLMPQIRYCTEKCIEAGYFSPDTTYEDFRVTLFSIFFEAWDTIDATLTFSDLSCKAYYKDGHTLQENAPYQADFCRPLAAYPEWYVEDARSVWTAGDGTLTKTVADSWGDRITLTDYTFTDFEMKFDMKQQAFPGGDGYFGLSLRKQGTVPRHTDWAGGIFCEITPAGRFRLSCPVENREVEAVLEGFRGDAWHHYRITAKGPVYTLFVDDQEVLRWEDPVNLYAAGGQIAFVGGGCTASVRAFSVTPC